MIKTAQTCELCGRSRPLTFHHLIPRTLHRNKWFKKRYSRDELRSGLELCRDCHSAIHRFVPREKDLGRDYWTKTLLLEHEQIAKFVAWVATRAGQQRVRRQRRA